MGSQIQRFYERWEGTIQIATLILIPLVVFLYGNGITRSIEQSKTEQDYIRIATGILSQEVQKDADQSAIRTWAADILVKYSPIPMTSEQRDSLIRGDARTYRWGGFEYSDGPLGFYDDYEPTPSVPTKAERSACSGTTNHSGKPRPSRKTK